MKYNEDRILQEALEYVASTYTGHYSGTDDVQLFDYWQSLGILTPVAIGTSMKYLARFGKKEGKNKKDLLKAMHYIVLAMYSEFYANEQFASDDGDDQSQENVLEQISKEGGVALSLEDLVLLLSDQELTNETQEGNANTQ